MLKEDGFDRWAEHYDVSVSHAQQGYPFEGYETALQSIRTQVAPCAGKRILDIGVGTGALSLPLYQQGATIWGLDFSSKMLQQARKQMPKGTFLRWSMQEELPSDIQNIQFHHVISSYAFHHIPPARQLAIIQQVLPCASESIMIVDIGFENLADLQMVKRQYEAAWDNDEYYMVGAWFREQLAALHLSARYRQISVCAGILAITVQSLSE